MLLDRSKRYRESAKQVEQKEYPPAEAVKLVKSTASAKFVERVELHIKTGADTRHANQQLRTVLSLPNGTGKSIRVFAFVEGDDALVAQQAGADYVMNDVLIKDIEKGWADFDASIATHNIMPKIAKLGRHLGRKNLMPSPRTGGVVQSKDIPDSISAAKKGRVEIRIDRTGVIHVPLGKVSFEDEQLIENLTAIYRTIVNAKPEGVKGEFILSATLCSTMGPGIKLNLSAIQQLL